MKHIIITLVIIFFVKISFAIPGGDDITSAVYVNTSNFTGELTPSNTPSGLSSSCFNSTYPDVYYSFTVNDPSVAVYYNSGQNPNNLNVRCQFFTFDGTNYNEIGCHLYNSIFPGIFLNGQTVGDIIYMRFVDWPGDQTGNVGFILLGTLPLSLISFEGRPFGDQNELTWVAEQAEQVDKAEIERSSDGIRFESIGEVPLSNTYTSVTYSWLDNDPFRQVYYRLKIIDIDESYEYSKVIAIENNRTLNQIVIFPNPTTKFLSTKGLRNDETVEVYSAYGRRIGTISNDQQLDLSNAQPGIYFVKSSNAIYKILKE